MEFTKEQQLKLDNYKAQYNSILKNISIANRELENLLQVAEDTQDSLAVAKNVINRVKEDKKTFEEYKDENFGEIARMSADILEREEQLEKKEKMLKDMEYKLGRKIEEKETKTEKILQDYREKIKSAESNLSVLDSKIVEKIKLIDEMKSKLDEATDQLNLTTNTNAELQKQITEDKDSFEKEKIKLEKELSLLKEQIREEQSKVGRANKSILEREEALKVKEHDLYIIETRIRKEYKRLFPKRELNL